ncbi:MAG: glycosyltransferase [Pyrinomonadaceae bacterium]
MRLAIVSHKVCWKSSDSANEFQTDGGFPLQVKAISELFDETKLLVPFEGVREKVGATPLEGKKLKVQPLSVSKSKGLARKMSFPLWLMKNGRTIWREIKRADAVHTPIPGDIGTIGMAFAILQRKPLFVRHCGNWLVQRTAAEHVWKWLMEYFAGGRNVMFATGGTEKAPSERNSCIKWIFSTSLKRENIERAVVRDFPQDGKLKLIIACRLENRKGVDVVIESLPSILKKYPKASLDVIGGGSLEQKLKERAEKLGLTENIRFHGKVAQSKVIDLMKQAHVFCFPTSASEGFPKVVIEALACGLPVITTRVSVLPRLIGNECGVLLDQPTSENLAGAVEKIFSEEEVFCRMSEKAVGTAKQYSLENWRDFIGENLRRAWNVSSLSSLGQ